MTGNEKILMADTRPTKRFLVQGATKDVTVEACIFDLIDNSIDAFSDATKKLHDNYNNYVVNIIINNQFFSIRDTGVGIKREKLSLNALRFGTTEKHGIGIGVYGVGLNRALFKIGLVSKITTENKNERLTVDLNVDKYLENDDDWNIPIKSENKTGKTETLIELTKLPDEVAAVFNNKDWIKKLQVEMSKKYSNFLSKGLQLIVNNTLIPKVDFSIRQDGDFAVLKKSFEMNDVQVSIEIGQHLNHRFSYEPSEKEKNVTQKECGWTVYCNDRAIIVFDWSPDTGWMTKNHSQYNGFIGKVAFVGDSEKLPWNTSKTGADLNHPVYKKALEIMMDFSKQWRTHTDRIRNGKIPSRKQVEYNLELLIDNSTSKDIKSSDLGSDILSNHNVHSNQSEVPIPVKVDGYVSNQAASNDVASVLYENAKSVQASVENTQKDAGVVPNQIVTTASVTMTSDEASNTTPASDNTVLAQIKTQKYHIPVHPLDRDYLFGTTPSAKVDFKIPASEIKLLAIVSEVSKLKLDENPFAVMFLLRAFIELSCDYFRETKKVVANLPNSISLVQKVSKCTSAMVANHWLLDGHEKSAIEALCLEGNKKSTNSIEYLQNSLHSRKNMWNKSSILAFWGDIHPFIRICFIS